MRLKVHNDFHQAHGLFPLFDDLEVEGLDRPIVVEKTDGTDETNGVGTEVNGIENIPLRNGSIEHH